LLRPYNKFVIEILNYNLITITNNYTFSIILITLTPVSDAEFISAFSNKSPGRFAQTLKGKLTAWSHWWETTCTLAIRFFHRDTASDQVPVF